MSTCSIKWCGKNSRTSSFKKDGITFHRFPKRAKIKSQWIDATQRGNEWFPRKFSVICSRHFTEDSFSVINHKRYVFGSAVPTLYLPILTSNTNEKENCSFSIKSEIPESDMSMSEMIPSLPTSINMIQPSSHNNIIPMTVETTRRKRKVVSLPDSPSAYKSVTSKRLCRRIIELKKLVLRKNRCIKNLRECNRRLKNKITSLNTLVGELHRKKNLCVCVLTTHGRSKISQK